MYKRQVREIVQCRPSVEYAEAELRAVLEGGAERERMKADFAELRRIIGGDGASERFAARMVEDLKMLKR